MHSVGSWGLWITFFIFIFIVLGVDVIVLNGKRMHRVSTYKALGWTLVWVSCALIFNLILWWSLTKTQGSEIANVRALEFFTGFVIEKSLSLDNMFVILMIFNFFTVPLEYQRRVLLYGVLGAVIMRFMMIFAGTWLVAEFHWILYLFGLFILYTGIHMFFAKENTQDLALHPLIVWLRKYVRVTPVFHRELFFIKQKALWYATPLFLTLVLVEFSDLIFAFDSIPAIFAITDDPFIIFTSNIFAILGLRALYFLLANAAERFHLLKYGVALILIFIGIKMLIEKWIEIPILLALGVVGVILLLTVLLSLIKRKN